MCSGLVQVAFTTVTSSFFKVALRLWNSNMMTERAGLAYPELNETCYTVECFMF